MACIFVFNGLDFGKKDQRPHVQQESVRAFEQAWDLYDQQQADQVVDAFSSAGMLMVESDLLERLALTVVCPRHPSTRVAIPVLAAHTSSTWRGLYRCSL